MRDDEIRTAGADSERVRGFGGMAPPNGLSVGSLGPFPGYHGHGSRLLFRVCMLSRLHWSRLCFARSYVKRVCQLGRSCPKPQEVPHMQEIRGLLATTPCRCRSCRGFGGVRPAHRAPASDADVQLIRLPHCLAAICHVGVSI